jgi:hypothetical protein
VSWPAATTLVPRSRAIAPLLGIGVLVFGTGDLADVLYHSAPAAWQPTLEAYLGTDGELAHLALFAGMVLVVAGLIQTGLRAGRGPLGPSEVRSPSLTTRTDRKHS